MPVGIWYMPPSGVNMWGEAAHKSNPAEPGVALMRALVEEPVAVAEGLESVAAGVAGSKPEV